MVAIFSKASISWSPTPVLGDEAALPDPGALDDPLVGRVEHVDQIGVGDDTFGNVVPDPEDAAVNHGETCLRPPVNRPGGATCRRNGVHNP